ncbi:MAG: SEC-C metal-binding domain-containing protein [Planctomycetota bacterium]|nr:SEC-C metal-binding domain-containing protein [Planctomycetota bacterium]
MTTSKSPAFESTSKRKHGYPSETHVKRGDRVVHGDKELIEKLGRNDPCPCGSNKSFQDLLPEVGLLLTASTATTTTGEAAGEALR